MLSEQVKNGYRVGVCFKPTSFKEYAAKRF